MKLKNIILTGIILLLVVGTASAQISWGVRTGMNISKFSPISESFKPGFQVGGILDIPIVDQKLFLQTGLYCINKNLFALDFMKYSYYNIVEKDNMAAFYASIPLLLSYRISINSDWNIGINTGGYFAYGFAGKSLSKFSNRETGNHYEIDGKTFNLLGNIDAGFELGVTLFYKKVSFTISSDWGWMTNTTQWLVGRDITISSFLMSMGYNF